ncbi:hypothetical protein CEUSTIGMA_g1267.t1 [Chlamydomonas eustigma]|uniref:Hemimethylated DNA-binding domain-containing protein n=1 Tax=Chlamydomonas eustigma TaxID=1157962 RepID=A0A250WSU5_9CHLO|nr:hypothetical protein CEUSTIGMA_g1267.t1 [Chlamydomonas eustigma]|eukprot:GAX73816.1 hypothetical protein CEUSTIGMA_g1267.t1 [Chlamydomonas eustigma]
MALSILSVQDLCSVACTCSHLRGLSVEQWQRRAFERWQSGWSSSKWKLLHEKGQHLALFSERHKIDRAAAQAVQDLSWPLRKDQSLQKLCQLDRDCLDYLIKHIDKHRCGNVPAMGISSEGRSPSPSDDEGTEGHQLGSAYWCWYALTQCQISLAVSDLSVIRHRPQQEHSRAIEHAALVLAQVHYPASCIEEIVDYLDLLGEELKLRLKEAGLNCGYVGRKELEVLNQLLFGEEAPPGIPCRLRPSPTADSSTLHYESSISNNTFYARLSQQVEIYPEDRVKGCWRCTLDDVEMTHDRPYDAHGKLKLPRIPPPGFGLGVKGNREDYQNPRNSLLPNVLCTRSGIPLSLAVLHMAVGRRAGLPMQLINMPMQVISKMRSGMTQYALHTSSGHEDIPLSTTDRGDMIEVEECKEEEEEEKKEEEEEDLYIDVYGGGTIMNKSELKSFMTDNLGLPSELPLEIMSPTSACQRMCANLAGIYSGRQDMEHLWMVLELLTAVNPRAKDFLGHKHRCALALRDFEGALKAVEQLEEIFISETGTDRRAYIADQFMALRVKISEQHLDYQRSCLRVATPAPPNVLYRVGQVIRHRRYRYRGVIFDWDPACQADEQWILRMGVDALDEGRNQPFYRVLVDLRDRPFQNTYVAQCNIEIFESDTSSEDGIMHPELGRYFDSFSSDRYHMNACLQARFC